MNCYAPERYEIPFRPYAARATAGGPVPEHPAGETRGTPEAEGGGGLEQTPPDIDLAGKSVKNTCPDRAVAQFTEGAAGLKNS